MSATLTTTPAGDGFRMPGEFEPHSATWLLWPERTSNWRCGAKPAQAAFAAVATAIATGEPPEVHGVQRLETRRLAGIQGILSPGDGAIWQSIRAATDVARNCLRVRSVMVRSLKCSAEATLDLNITPGEPWR